MERITQTETQLISMLKDIWNDKEFVIGVANDLETDSERQLVMDYINSREEVTPEEVVLLSLQIEDERKKLSLIAELKNTIAECCNDVLFVYNGKKSGITAEVKDSIPTFQVWHGSETKEYVDIEVLMADKFFSGRAINDLADEVTFTIV